MKTASGSLIAGEWRPGTGAAFQAVDPATGALLQPLFHEAVAADVHDACDAAWEAYRGISTQPAEVRAVLLEGIASGLEAIAEPLIARTMQESALPQARVTGELGRTTGQLRLFASEVRAGHWRGLRIDPALPDRQPLPRPDIRMRRIPVGPVAVFGASNFPLAFSVAGGDTASAFAAGCPVVVKAHPAHPGTSDLVADVIAKAVQAAGLPPGMFSMVHGGNEIGAALVKHPAIRAVGFTGSRRGGFALMDLAAARPVPIPVFAEMSSINPVLLFPHALRRRGKDLGAAFGASLTLGAGQFCTNPGLALIVGADDASYEAFRNGLASFVESSAGQPMLSDGIASSYIAGLDAMQEAEGVRQVAKGQSGEHLAPACVFETDARTFARSPALQAENFGASTLLIRCDSTEEAAALLESMEGQLTATLQIEEEDQPEAAALLPALERLVGRILVNGFPTGVEVCHAMVHGGPYPATSDSRTTSVGTLAIDRFLRPVSYQNFPEGLLPDELHDSNPTGARRRLNGEY